MKKVLLILCLLLLIPQSFGVAFGCEESKSCLISDKPADVLTQYIKDLSQITNNVSSAARWATIDKGAIWKIRSQTLRITNATAGFWWYFSSFDYYVAYPITHDIPYQIERDHRLLLNQNTRLLSKIKTILRSGGADIIVKDACRGITTPCNFNNQTAENILSALLKNHKKVVYLYQLNVLGKTSNFKDNLVLVDNTFQSKLSSHYWPDSVKTCSACEDWFEGRIKESISNIWKINENSEGAVNKWKYAWAVLTGNEESAEEFLTRTWTGTRKDYYTESLWLWEENVLKRYLWETWAGAKTTEIALANLNRYNNSWSLVNKGKLNTSNPLENTARNIFSDIETEFDTFDESVIQEYENRGEKDIPTVDLQNTQDSIEVTKRIKRNIAELYERQQSTNVVQDTGVEKLQAKMIQMHVSLSNSISRLHKVTKKSEKVCNSQWKWLWKCNYE